MGSSFGLSGAVRAILVRVIRASTGQRRLVERSRIVLMTVEGVSDAEQARQLGVDSQRIRRWRRRWSSKAATLAEAEAGGATAKDLEAAVLAVLDDAPRSGAPSKFSAEQIVQLVALACANPRDHGVPISHWSARELARKAVEMGIFPSISSRQVSRFLDEADLRPHRTQYWLTSPDKLANPEEYRENVQRVCDTYAQAQQLEAEGVHVVSTDEKTGIQALERKHEAKPMRPGVDERREFEYIRHGTLGIIISFMVASGLIGMPTIAESRGNSDFLEHIEATVDLDPEAGWVFVADRLNTHMSEELVQMVAKRCGIDVDLGAKGKRGILESMKSRCAFLEDPSHRIRFVFTPRHASWLNQVEIWFGILSRRLLKRESFKSLDDLSARIGEFITYFNAVLAKPFRWTYGARPLQA